MTRVFSPNEMQELKKKKKTEVKQLMNNVQALWHWLAVHPSGRVQNLRRIPQAVVIGDSFDSTGACN
jgi:hypothetical protein